MSTFIFVLLALIAIVIISCTAKNLAQPAPTGRNITNQSDLIVSAPK